MDCIYILRFLTLLLPILYLILAPYTKVEESFNIQAIHDLITYGYKGLDKFDHIQFPGVVPRTFLGSIVIAHIVKSLSFFINLFFNTFNIKVDLNVKLLNLYLARSILGIASSISILSIGTQLRQIAKKYEYWYLLYSIIPFHYNFWCTRTLPNIFALILVNFSIVYWLKLIILKIDEPKSEPYKKYQSKDKEENIRFMLIIKFVGILLSTALIFRSEVFFLLAFLGLSDIITNLSFYFKLSRFLKLLFITILVTIISLVTTITIDSYFWKNSIFIKNTWLWPEGYVFYFNAILNKSQEWGTSPFNYYFINSLPKINGISYIMTIIGLLLISIISITKNQLTRNLKEARIFLLINSKITLPILTYITFMSIHEHKEWRFIIYILPLLNISATCTTVFLLSYINKKNWKLTSFTTRFLLNWCLFICFCITMLLVFISSLNYPGGEALYMIHQINNKYDNNLNKTINIHMDVATAMNGASRFLEIGDKEQWNYDKLENLNQPNEYLNYTYLLTYNPKFHLNNNNEQSNINNDINWKVIGISYGFNKVIITSPKLWLNRVTSIHPLSLLIKSKNEDNSNNNQNSNVKDNRYYYRKLGLIFLEHFTPLKIEFVPKCYILKNQLI
ncbi:hypothetical protein K502DRAFT_361753 [Neoconidiobolus thromboides FSU 785]|nr:hypothetical protein K502DRAFT_361753 [Neoconidiobolus thromboides FSU 785]